MQSYVKIYHCKLGSIHTKESADKMSLRDVNFSVKYHQVTFTEIMFYILLQLKNLFFFKYRHLLMTVRFWLIQFRMNFTETGFSIIILKNASKLYVHVIYQEVGLANTEKHDIYNDENRSLHAFHLSKFHCMFSV